MSELWLWDGDVFVAHRSAQTGEGGAGKETGGVREHFGRLSESHYWWQGKLEEAKECLLLIKTTQAQSEAP